MTPGELGCCVFDFLQESDNARQLFLLWAAGQGYSDSQIEDAFKQAHASVGISYPGLTKDGGQ